MFVNSIALDIDIYLYLYLYVSTYSIYSIYVFVSIANCGIVAGPVGAAAGSPASCHAPGPIYIHGGSMNEYLYIYIWVGR